MYAEKVTLFFVFFLTLPLALLYKEINSLGLEFSSPPRFRIQGGSMSFTHGGEQTKILVANIGWLLFNRYCDEVWFNKCK